MKVYPVQMNNLAVKAPNFKAYFIHNEISRDLNLQKRNNTTI